MIARRRDGSLGRVVKNRGMGVEIEKPHLGVTHGSVNISPSAVAQDEAYRQAQTAKAISLERAKRVRAAVAETHRKMQYEKNRQEIERQQKIKPLGMSDQDKIRRHFINQARMTETQRVENSLRGGFGDQQMISQDTEYSDTAPGAVEYSPESVARSMKANFNPLELVPDDGFQRTIVDRADFRRNHNIVGSPLTRDGSYGVVTDWDRFVCGHEDIETVPMSQDTIVRKFGNPELATMGNFSGPRAMGDDSTDSSWLSDVGDWISEASSNFSDTVQEALPAALATQVVKQATGGNTKTPAPASHPTTTVISAAPGSVASMAQSMGVSPAILYGFLGLMGVGVLAMVVKAVKS